MQLFIIKSNIHLHNSDYLHLDCIPAYKRNRKTRTCSHMCVHIHHLKLHTHRYLEIQEKIDQFGLTWNVINGTID